MNFETQVYTKCSFCIKSCSILLIKHKFSINDGKFLSALISIENHCKWKNFQNYEFIVDFNPYKIIDIINYGILIKDVYLPSRLRSLEPKVDLLTTKPFLLH